MLTSVLLFSDKAIFLEKKNYLTMGQVSATDKNKGPSTMLENLWSVTRMAKGVKLSSKGL